MAQLLLSIQRARLGYPGTEVLSALDWEVRYGDRWLIVGPNGAGKTTLLKTLLGLTPLLGGDMQYYSPTGEAIHAPSIGYLPQINQIDRAFPISAREVIASGLQGCSLSRDGRHERIAELLEAIDLESMGHLPIGALSGGQLQRILLARALASRPQLVVLDEPTSFLDRRYKEQFDELLLRLIPEEATILMVTHDMQPTHLDQWQSLALGRW